MRYRSLLSGFILLFSLMSIELRAQQQDTLRVFFDTDKDAGFATKALDGFWSDRSAEEAIIERIEVVGHADVRGTAEYNQALAQRRADTVAEYLRKHWDRSLSIEVRSKGEEDGKPTTADRLLAKQRRVDVVVSWKDPMPQLKPIVEQPMIQEPEEDVIAIDTVSKNNVVLEGLSFIPGRHYPTPESMPILFKLVNTMKKYDQLEIEIQGHICCSYDAEDGMDNDTGEPFLSRNRAEFVYDFLVEYGIDEDRMTFTGLGSTQPKVFPEESDADRQANRRVEIKVK